MFSGLSKLLFTIFSKGFSAFQKSVIELDNSFIFIFKSKGTETKRQVEIYINVNIPFLFIALSRIS